MLWQWLLPLPFVASMLAYRWELSRVYRDARIPAPWDDDVPRHSPRLGVLRNLTRGTYIGAVFAQGLLPLLVTLAVLMPVILWLHARHNRRFPEPSRWISTQTPTEV